MGPTLTSSTRQPPASATAAASPVILNSAVLRGADTLAGNSFSVAAIRSTSWDAFLPAS